MPRSPSRCTDHAKYGLGAKRAQLLLQQERVRAQIDELAPRDDAGGDLLDLLVQQRLAAGDRHDRGAAFVDGVEALLHGKTLVEYFVRIVDLAAARACEVAAEQRLEHQNERVAAAAGEPLAHHVGADAGDLAQWNRHGVSRSAGGRDFVRFSNSTGSRNATVSSMPGSVVTSHAPSRTSAATTSCTSASGADAPAVSSDGLGTAHPLRLELARIGNQVARLAGFDADLAQSVGVGAVPRADDEDHVGELRELAHRALAILRRITDVADVGPDDVDETLLERRDDGARIVDAQRRLRDVGDRRIAWEVDRRDVGRRLHEDDRPRDLADRALDFRMPRVADENHRAALRDVTLALAMHLGNQRTRRVEDLQLAFARLVLDRLGDAMSAEDRARAGRHLAQMLDEARALRAERFDDVAIVDDLMTHVDGRPEALERLLDDVDCADDTGTKPSWLRENDAHAASSVGMARNPKSRAGMHV